MEIDKALHEDLDSYQEWIEMDWGLNRHEDDDVFPIITLRDELHKLVVSGSDEISEEGLQRLRELDTKWQQSLVKNRDPSFHFDFKDFNEPKSKWWWWIDRLDELSEEERSAL